MSQGAQRAPSLEENGAGSSDTGIAASSAELDVPGLDRASSSSSWLAARGVRGTGQEPELIADIVVASAATA